MTNPQNQPERWLIFLHGIYGAGRNWQSIARKLSENRPEWGCILVDLRLHGNSQNFEPPHTVAACAKDVAELVDYLNLPVAAVAGHSFGGKVALLCAQTGLVGLEQIWIMDSTPETRTPKGDAWELLETIRALPATFLARQVAIEAMQAKGFSLDLARWMATNLIQVEGLWQWKLDFGGLEAMLLDFFKLDLWQLVEQPPTGLELHFVKAENSSVLSTAGVTRLEAISEKNRKVFLHKISGGHWINVENPQGVLELLEEWLP